MAPVPKGGLKISGDGKTATLEINNLAVIDQPKWPALDSRTTPAKMSFKVVWKATDKPANLDDASKHFRFTGFEASAQLAARVEVPSIGFSWKSDPISTSSASFAIIGEEVNGRYYDSAK